MQTRFLYVYILKCSDNTFYTGITNDLHRRMQEHSSGMYINSYTFSRLPVEIVYYEQFSSFILAINWEKRIKNWSKKKKEALINGNWIDVALEATCKNETKSKIKDL